MLSWTKHVNLCVAKAYGKLRQVCRFKNFLTDKVKWNICETYILSNFNYGDIILQGLSNQLENKIQKIQNSCIRFSFGLRKYDHITNTRLSNNIISMHDRRLLHCLTLMFKIVRKMAPVYLCNRITYKRQIHNYNTRRKNDIQTSFARTRFKALSFFIEIANKYNELSQHFDFSGISVATFKMKCKKYLLNNEHYLNQT